ncbi:WD repeat-containing protein 91 [Biomphalaria pfeifferi]|uniref:WD repeat-containing protein 91 n=1 Tax=Biomphalaria pfeifferi TaxID=112525 RepID=A0AAD8EYL4_BIOPF|nr:WD repeat-containing protein 91 [Biomphalaria pfeifferi]
MAASCEKLDQLVKDYLLFRGFSTTLKILDQELKTDKDKGLRVDRMMEQIWTYLSNFDLQGLRDYWRYLNQRLFSRLEQRYALSVRKLESSLLKLYVVNAHQGGKQDKVLGFYEQLGADLQTHPDFKDWFAFPFVTNPAENPMRMKTLQEENTSLKQQLMNSATATVDMGAEAKVKPRHAVHMDLPPPPSPPDMVYDFSGLASDSDSSNQEKQKTTRRFLSLTSPLMGRKKSDAAPIKPKTTGTAAPAALVVSGAQGKLSKVAETTTTPSLTTASEGRKMSVPSSHPSSITAASEAAKSQPFSKVFGSSGSSQQLSSLSRHATFSAGDTHPSSLLTTNRSLSVPANKLPASSKKILDAVKKKPEAQLSGLSSTEVPNAASALEAVSDQDDTAYVTDSDCPFLLLEVDEYIEHSSAAAFCRFSLSGQYVASLDVDGIVKVWMWSPQPATIATVMSKSAFLSLAWASKSDRWLLLGNKTGSLRLFDLKDSKAHKEVLVSPDNPANCMRVTDLSISPSSSQFACVTADYCPFSTSLNNVSGRLFLWDLRSLKMERMLPVESVLCNAITCSSYSRNSQTLLTGGADGTLRLYDVHSQKPVIKWPGHDSPIHTVHFHGDKSVYSMSADGKLYEWNLSCPGQVINSLNCGTREFLANKPGSCRGRLFALDTDYDQYLLTYNGRRGSIYKILDASCPTLAMDLKLHQSPVVSVDWSSSQGTRVCLTSSADAKIKISTLLSK